MFSVPFNFRGKESFISSLHLNSRWADTEFFQESECVGKSLGRSSNIMYITDVDKSHCRTRGEAILAGVELAFSGYFFKNINALTLI